MVYVLFLVGQLKRYIGRPTTLTNNWWSLITYYLLTTLPGSDRSPPIST